LGKKSNENYCPSEELAQVLLTAMPRLLHQAERYPVSLIIQNSLKQMNISCCVLFVEILAGTTAENPEDLVPRNPANREKSDEEMHVHPRLNLSTAFRIDLPLCAQPDLAVVFVLSA
jgi:hypothetical protein